MTRIISHLVFLAGFLLVSGCGATSSGRTDILSPILPGTVAERIICKKFPGYTYAIYLPSYYLKSDSLPVILAFDPGSSGVIPVRNYKDLAEKYGFILIGSNDSRNGQTIAQTEQIIFALMEEIHTQYAIQPERIYCTGFSGGARVSAIIGFYRGGIHGVIGCGAGLPVAETAPRYRTNFFGIVGTGDFNYAEMVFLEKQFQQQGIRSRLKIFDGIHDWPPESVFEQALRWHQAQAMKEGLISPDTTLIDEVDEQSATDHQILASINLKKLEKEQKKQEYYAEAYLTQSVTWWKKQLSLLKNPPDPDDRLMNARLASYLGVLSYTLSSQAIAEQDKEKLSHIIAVYELIEPDNNYIPTLKTRLKSLP